MPKRLVAMGFGLASVMLLTPGCGGSSDGQEPGPVEGEDEGRRVVVVASGDVAAGSEAQSPDGETITERRLMGYPLWAPDSGRDVATMAGRHHALVVVRVLGREDLTWAESLPGVGSREDFPSVDSDGNPIDLDEVDEGLPRDHPKANATRPAIDPEAYPPTLSRYSVEVIEVLAGAVPPEGFAVFQSGGVRDGIAYEVEGNPVIEVGRTYVMFLSLDSNGWYWSTPWGRFEVVEGGALVAVAEEEWKFLGFRQALAGKRLDDLRASVRGLTFRLE